MRTARGLVALVAVVVAAGAVSCSRVHRDQPPAADQGPAAQVRLGYFANVTHASALVGLHDGFFARELGRTALRTQVFDSGPNEASALLGGSLDVAFIGPGPAIDAFSQSDGQAVRLVAGATSGGAELVTRSGIGTVAALHGATVASPELGNTQDIALKTWARARHAVIQVLNSANAQIVAEFAGGRIAAAWLPEPWASMLVLRDHGHVLVDERTLWPGGRFPTTVIVVRTTFLQEHRQTVEALLRGELAADTWTRAHPALARAVVNTELTRLTGKPLSDAVLRRAFAHITLDTDPQPTALRTEAQHAVDAGVAARVPDLRGFVDPSALDAVQRDPAPGDRSGQ